MRSWENLSPKGLNRRAGRVAQYARQAGGDSFESSDELDGLLGGRSPEGVERLLQEARDRIERGDGDVEKHAEQLVRRLKATGASEEHAERLHQIIRHALKTGASLGEAAAHAAKEVEDVPDEAERDSIRMAAAGEAIRFARYHGGKQPEHLRYGRREVNAAGNLMAAWAAKGRKLTFERAVEIIRGR
jgi:hypothetical protein